MSRPLTLQAVVLTVARFLHDCVEGVTDVSEGDRARMRDSRRVLNRPDAYRFSDVLFLDNPAALTGHNPKQVVGYDPTGGRFVLNDNYAADHGVPAGVHYALLNIGGAGQPYPGYIAALNVAVQALGFGWLAAVPLDVAATVATAQRGVALPDGLDTLFGVEVVGSSGYRTALVPGPRGWTVTPPRTLNLGELAAGAVGVVCHGHRYGEWLSPLSPLDTPVPGALDDLVLVAAEEMLRSSGRQREAQEAMTLVQERVRTRQPTRWPNEVPLQRVAAVTVAGGRAWPTM